MSVRRWPVAVVVAFAVAVAGWPAIPGGADAAEASVVVSEPVGVNRLPAVAAGRVLPVVSGALPAIPPNPTLLRAGDGGVAAPPNHDLEAPGFSPGTAANHDFATAPVVVATPSNADFETGDFSGWETAGSPSIAPDATGGSAALLAASGDRVTSSVLSLPADAAALSLDVGFVSASWYSWLNVYVLHGAGFGVETKIGQRFCLRCGGVWEPVSFDVSSFAGEDVKVEFAGSLGL